MEMEGYREMSSSSLMSAVGRVLPICRRLILAIYWPWQYRPFTTVALERWAKTHPSLFPFFYSFPPLSSVSPLFPFPHGRHAKHSPLLFSLLLPLPPHPQPLIQIQLWSAVSSVSGSWRSPATKRILVYFQIKSTRLVMRTWIDNSQIR